MCLHFGSGLNSRRIVGNCTTGRIWLELNLWLLVHYILYSVIEGLLIFIAGSLATLLAHFYSEKLHYKVSKNLPCFFSKIFIIKIDFIFWNIKEQISVNSF